jgi:hypothetical protein
MTPKAFRRLALSLPEAHEAPHFDRASFRVGKRIFATMTGDGSEAMIRVEPRARLYALLKAQPELFFSYAGYTERGGALGIHLARADRDTVRQLLVDSWRRIAPKRALAMLAACDERA